MSTDTSCNDQVRLEDDTNGEENQKDFFLTLCGSDAQTLSEKIIKNTDKTTHFDDCDDCDDCDDAKDADGAKDDDMNEAFDLLETMDIDRDFNIWESFRKSLSLKKSQTEAELKLKHTDIIETPQEDYKSENHLQLDSLTEDYRFLSQLPQKDFLSDIGETVKEEALKASTKVMNSRIFSSQYLPVPREKREIEGLAQFLCVKKTSKNQHYSKIIQLLFPEAGEPKSILLKREPVLLRAGIENESSHERELILLSHGIIIATISGQNKTDLPTEKTTKLNMFKTMKDKLIRRKFESCVLFSDIVSIQDPVITESDNIQNKYENEPTFMIEVVGDSVPKKLYFSCATQSQKDFWIHALSWAYYNHTKFQTEEIQHDADNGFHHKTVLSTLYTAAVLGNEEMYHRIKLLSPSIKLDELDAFHGYSALHYAILWDNVDFARILIKDGANVNVGCQDSSSPLYHAKRLKIEAAIGLLNEYSAINVPPQKSDKEAQKGKTRESFGLFGMGRGQSREERKKNLFWENLSLRFAQNLRDETNCQKLPSTPSLTNNKTQNLTNTMTDNKNMLLERGEKLEQLSEKTAQLERDAQEYKDNAKKLRQALDKRSKRWLLF